jgi:hypothetical protein
MTDYAKLYQRRFDIDNINLFYSNSDFVYETNVHLLPFHMLRFLAKIGVKRLRNEGIFHLLSTHIVVHNIFEELRNMVARVIETQKIKQELFKRTIPGYQPPTIRQHLTELLGFDVSHISMRGLLMIQRWFEIYRDVDDRYMFEDDDYFDSSRIEYIFDIMVCAMDNTSLFKEELVAKVYHPDRVDKWVNYV